MPVQRILDVADTAVGQCTVVADLSWPHGESVVLDLAAADGSRYVGKAYRRAAKFAAELHAYRSWVPALDNRAPQLIDADEERRVLLITRLDARHLTNEQAGDDPDVSRQAGQLLRRFHDSQAGMPVVGYAERQRIRVEEWVARARPGLLSEEEVAFARAQLAVFRRQDDPIGVPCHRDWQQRNWLIDEEGRLSVIDFEHARVGPWHDDLHRLWWADWRVRPTLTAAFFDGYGRDPRDDEREALFAASSIGHLCTIVWSDEHEDVSFGDYGRRSLQAAMAPHRPT